MQMMKREILFIYLFLVLNCQFTRPLYKCVHDESEERNHLENIIIKNDGTEKRRVDEGTAESEFKEFNIVIDFENIKNDIEKYGLKDKEDFYISSMNKAVETLKSLLKVKPLKTINGSYYIDDNNLKRLNLEKWNKTMFGNEAMQNQTSFQKLGIDLAIFGTFMDLPSSTLATASAQLYQPGDGQPYLGLVKINKNIDYSKPNSQIYFESILVHEFTHILGFSHHFFETYLKHIYNKTDENGLNRIYLNSPKLLEVAKKYYNCENIEGVELENQGGTGTAGSHWEARILLGEYMNGYSYTEEQVISEFTLAVLEDLGYYKANYYTGGLMRFGKHKGCEFLNNKCVDKTTHKINEKFENEFYDTISGFKVIESSCSSGRQSRTYNAWYMNDTVPEIYQYFENPKILGYEPADFCPIPLSFQEEEELSYFTGHCSIVGSGGYGTQIRYDGTTIDPKSGKLLDYTGEQFTDHSFCYLSSLTKNDKMSKVVRANCYETFCSEKSLTIKIFDDYIVCPRAGGKIKVKGYLGYLLCPDYNLICSGEKLCNNIFDCVDMKSLVKEESYTYDYEIKTSQNIEKANSAESYETDNYELGDNGKCKKYCKHCKNNKCQDCADGYNLLMETNGDINCRESASIPQEGYYLNSDNVYIKCIDNCIACEDLTSCKKCNTDYKYFQNACVKITEEEKERLINNCLEYDSNYNCLRCEDGYAFKKDESNKCYNIETELVEYYTKDKGFSYIPCSSSNVNCTKCYYSKDEYRVKCTLCKDDLVLLEKGKGICMTKDEIKNKTKYYLVNDTNARECQKDIENCASCDSIDNCLKCKYNYEFDIVQKKCLQKVKSKDDGEAGNSGINIGGSKESSSTTKTKTESSIKRKKVKKNKNNSNYYSISNIILLQALYIIFILIKF